MAKHKKPTNPCLAKVKAWPSTTLIDRLIACRAMLYLFDALTEAESERVLGRLIKWNKKFNK